MDRSLPAKAVATAVTEETPGERVTQVLKGTRIDPLLEETRNDRCSVTGRQPAALLEQVTGLNGPRKRPQTARSSADKLNADYDCCDR
jgi:hypothetical protein